MTTAVGCSATIVIGSGESFVLLDLGRLPRRDPNQRPKVASGQRNRRPRGRDATCVSRHADAQGARQRDEAQRRRQHERLTVEPDGNRRTRSGLRIRGTTTGARRRNAGAGRSSRVSPAWRLAPAPRMRAAKMPSRPVSRCGRVPAPPRRRSWYGLFETITRAASPQSLACGAVEPELAGGASCPSISGSIRFQVPSLAFRYASDCTTRA